MNIQDLINEAEFGDRVQALVQGEIGDYLDQCALEDEQTAMKELIDIDPYKFSTLGELQSAISKCQEEVLIARKILGYLGDAIIRGQEADQQLTEE